MAKKEAVFGFAKALLRGAIGARGSAPLPPVTDDEFKEVLASMNMDTSRESRVNVSDLKGVQNIVDEHHRNDVKIANLQTSTRTIGDDLRTKYRTVRKDASGLDQINTNFQSINVELERVQENFSILNRAITQLRGNTNASVRNMSVHVDRSLKKIDTRFEIIQQRILRLESKNEGSDQYKASTVSALPKATPVMPPMSAPTSDSGGSGLGTLGTAGASAAAGAAATSAKSRSTIATLKRLIGKIGWKRAGAILAKRGVAVGAGALLGPIGVAAILALSAYEIYDIICELEEEAGEGNSNRDIDKEVKEVEQKAKAKPDYVGKPHPRGTRGMPMAVPGPTGQANRPMLPPSPYGSQQNQTTFANNFDRQMVEREKGQFLKYGALPAGFEFLPGNRGMLGNPAAVAATGAMPLSGSYSGGGFGVPGGSFGGGGGYGGGGASPGGGGGASPGGGGGGASPGGGGGGASPGGGTGAPSVGGLSRTKYEALFKGTPLESHYETVIAAAQKHGLDPTLMAAVMVHETGKGKNVNYNNPAGLMDPKANWQRKIRFDTLEEGIMSAAKNMKKNFDRGGGTVEGMGAIYAPPGAANDPHNKNKYWPGGVRSYMEQLGESGQPTSGTTQPTTPSSESSSTGFINTWEKYGKENDLSSDSTSKKDLEKVTNIVAHDISADKDTIRAIKALAKKEGISEAEAGYRLIPNVDDKQVRKSYHVTFDDKGWSLNRPLDKQAPHAADFNPTTIGLSHRGIEGAAPSASALKHGAYAAAYIMKKYPHLKLEDILTHPELGPKGTRQGGKDAAEGSWREDVKKYIQENKLLDMSESELMGSSTATAGDNPGQGPTLEDRSKNMDLVSTPPEPIPLKDRGMTRYNKQAEEELKISKALPDSNVIAGSNIAGYDPNAKYKGYNNASSKYVNENFLPAMNDFIGGLGMAKAIGENPYVRQGKFYEDRRAGVAAGVHSASGHHYGGQGALAADISGGQYRPDFVKQAGGERNSREMIAALGDLMFHPEVRKVIKPRELINRDRRINSRGYSRGGGHPSHVHFAPGAGVSREAYQKLVAEIIQNPEKFGEAGIRYRNAAVAAGIWVKNPDGGFMLNPEKFQNQPVQPQLKQQQILGIPTQPNIQPSIRSPVDIQRETMAEFGIGARGGGAGIASGVMESTPDMERRFAENEAEKQDDRVRAVQQRMRDEAALGVKEGTPIKVTKENAVGEAGGIVSQRRMTAEEDGVKKEAVAPPPPPPPREGSRERSEPTMSNPEEAAAVSPKGEKSGPASKAVSADTDPVRGGDDGPDINGGRNGPETQESEPGSGGYGNCGRCFI